MTITGDGKRELGRTDGLSPYLVRVADGGHAIFEDCILEGAHEGSHEVGASAAWAVGSREINNQLPFGS